MRCAAPPSSDERDSVRELRELREKGQQMAELIHKELAFEVVGAAMEVHRVLGPGFLEQVYQAALEHELNLRAIPFVSQQPIRVPYKGALIADYYLDLVVDGKIGVELKAIGQLSAVHEAQVLSYLKASGLQLGLLFNFGEESLRFKRIVLSADHHSRNSRNSRTESPAG